MLSFFPEESPRQLIRFVYEICNEAGPASLMACAEASAGVAVKIFIKEKVITPVRILLEFGGIAEDGSGVRMNRGRKWRSCVERFPQPSRAE